MLTTINSNLRGFINCLVFSILAILTSTVSGCKKFVQIDPPFTSVNERNIFEDDGLAAGAISEIYGSLSSENKGFQIGSLSALSCFAGLSADELLPYNLNPTDETTRYFLNSLLPSSSSSYWGNLYGYIFKVNSVIKGVTDNNTLSPSIQRQILGEAKFMRAFFYFYLVNLFGEIPLALTTDPYTNRLLSRSSVDDVYSQIITDLEDATELLSEKYLNGTLTMETSDRVRPTRWAAVGLLARVYLYRENYQSALDKSSEIIANTTTFQLDTLNGVFLKTSKEAIWQIQSIQVSNSNTGEANFFILPDGTAPSEEYPYTISQQLLNSFESNDLRKYNWLGYSQVKHEMQEPLTVDTFYYSYKYKVGRSNEDVSDIKEYLMVLRLAEIFLIRAESKFMLGDIDGANADLNMIRRRAGLSEVNGDASNIQDIIFHERQVELFTEWGHRWLDMKRTKRIDTIMAQVAGSKGSEWKTFSQLYPVPLYDILSDPNLTQNPGY